MEAAPNPPVVDSAPENADGASAPKRRPPRVRPGDWVCPTCQVNVFASKSECFKCQAPKPENAAPAVAAPRLDDWICPNCQASVFASKSACYKCSTPKGDNAVTAPRGEGRGGRGRGRGRGRGPRSGAAADGAPREPRAPREKKEDTPQPGFLGLPPTKVPLVDVGINLMHKSFAKSLDDIVKRSIENGVTTLIITGTTEPASQAALELAQTFKLAEPPTEVATGTKPSRMLYSTAGVHPHDAKRWEDTTLATLRKLLAEDGKGIAVAVGECGLDFNRNFSPRPVQEEVFEHQVKLAVELELPLFCHEREASESFLAILDKVPGADKLRVCVHCFTGTEDELKEYVRRGFYLGFTGCICDERRGKSLRPLLPLVPLDRIMLETDAPFMMPTGARGRNEPANLVAVLRTAAEAYGKPEEDVAKATTENAMRFFKL
mmetsp:Transcript_17759/g.43062  ORF Transcript_17759/g.43062 Transcript_17759/m.43062 type:complete len:434 (+) Transcript_17759:119-1420(+)